MEQRRDFLKKAAKLGSAASMGAMAAAAATGPAGRAKTAGGIRLGNLYFSSGLTGGRAEARKNPLAFGGGIKEKKQKIFGVQKSKPETMGASPENVLKETGFFA